MALFGFFSRQVSNSGNNSNVMPFYKLKAVVCDFDRGNPPVLSQEMILIKEKSILFFWHCLSERQKDDPS